MNPPFRLLARSNITVYLADRSGVLGAENFDMHDAGDLIIVVQLQLLNTIRKRSLAYLYV